jgi:hypothetical protein
VGAPNAILDALPGVDRPTVDRLARVVDGFGSLPRYAVVPKSAEPLGWSVDRSTGSLFGVLSSGAGGGEEVAEINRVFDQIESTLTMAGVYNDVASLLGFGGMSFAGGVWLQLEAAKLKKLRAATIAIATLGDDDPDLADLLDLSDLGCGLLQSLAQEALPDVLAQLGGQHPEEIATIVSLTDGLENLALGEGLVC